MKPSYSTAPILFIAFLISCTEKPVPGKQALVTEGFPNKVLDAYWIYLPKTYDETKKWPMIMFLEGGDASASPNPNTVKDGGPVAHLLSQQNLPDSFVIVNPHMRTGSRNQRQWFKNADGLVQMVDQVIKKHHVDPDRIYLTGQSRGGHGAWGVAKRFPEKFAAIVPIAGALNCESGCEKMVDLPVWILHNSEDPVVKYDYPKTTVDYFEKELARSFLKTSNMNQQVSLLRSTAIFTTFESDQHGGAGSKAYGSPVFYQWLLSQRRK